MIGGTEDLPLFTLRPVFLNAVWFWRLRLWREDLGGHRLQFLGSSTSAAGQKRVFLQRVVACSSRGFGFILRSSSVYQSFDMFNLEFISFVCISLALMCVVNLREGGTARFETCCRRFPGPWFAFYAMSMKLRVHSAASQFITSIGQYWKTFIRSFRSSVLFVPKGKQIFAGDIARRLGFSSWRLREHDAEPSFIGFGTGSTLVFVLLLRHLKRRNPENELNNQNIQWTFWDFVWGRPHAEV